MVTMRGAQPTPPLPTQGGEAWKRAVAAKRQPMLPDADARMLAWANGMRAAKASGAFGDGPLRLGTAADRIACERERYARDEIDLEEFERRVAEALA
jgi:hypothetical protein